ncbi:MAG TPA: hypothetical protein VHG35_04980 [Gemmatimonadales bacterium]|nr:hypothetical protein [Gemmatimonadales bacterium]
MSKAEKNWLEWTVFGVGLVLVLATLGYLVRESLVTHDGPPEVIARLGAPRPSAGGYLVPVEVSNVGQATAEDVRVRVFLDLPDGAREEAEFDVAFLPRGSLRKGWASFRNDPARGSLRLGAIAFEEP